MGLINKKRLLRWRIFTTLYYHNNYNVKDIFFKKKNMGPIKITEGEGLKKVDNLILSRINCEYKRI